MWQLAQVNVAVMRAPLGDPSMGGFVMAFDAVARLAEEAPGFVWRLRDGGGGGHVVVGDEVVNVTVWRDYRSMHEFVYRSLHGGMVARRRQWFLSTRQPATALWWVAAGSEPTIEEALARLEYLRRYGPSVKAFSLLRQFDSEGVPLSVGRGGPGARRPGSRSRRLPR